MLITKHFNLKYKLCEVNSFSCMHAKAAVKSNLNTYCNFISAKYN